MFGAKIAISPAIIEAIKVNNTFHPNIFSPNRYARVPFTILLDMTAMRIVVPAITAASSHDFALTDIV
jgi:hypothetical protein